MATALPKPSELSQDRRFVNAGSACPHVRQQQLVRFGPFTIGSR
jgi:hypothetical protein